jgi:hypothetical protein
LSLLSLTKRDNVIVCFRNKFGDMLQHLIWCSLEDRCKDARLVMMYKLANENVFISKTDNHIISLCKTQQRQES